MEEHLWTSSFWRLLSNCSDSRKLLIVQKIILHKLGNGPEVTHNLNKIIKNLSMSLPNDKQDKYTGKPVKNQCISINKHQCLISQLNEKNTEDTITKVNVAPVMGTNALLAKYKNCVESAESKIVAKLVNAKFNKEYTEEVIYVQDRKSDLDILNIPEEIMDNTTPATFDEKKFLEDALGDEINSFTGTEFEDPEFEEDDTIQPEEQSISITSSRVSSLISRATSVYSSLKKRVRRPTSSSHKEPKPNTHSPIVNTEVNFLLQEASVQHQIIIEACKALNVCLSSKEFLFGPEHIEAERILLLAMYKQNTVLKEMKQLKYIRDKSNMSISRGYAIISCLKFPLTAKTQKEGYINLFVAIASCGGSVFVTNSAHIDSNNIVQFQEEFKFENLQHDFEIHVSIYSLLAKSNANNNGWDSKCHLKNEETATCLRTPDKFLCRRNSIKRTKQYSFERREPSFKLWGKTTATISDQERSAPFQLEQVPSGTTIKGLVLMNFNTRVEFEENHSDFLTIRTEVDNCMAWNHRWCNLIGHTLYYWNYPADQDLVEPIGKINLQQCIASEIYAVDRNLCARPRTLLVETAESSEHGTLFLRHFLSADSTEKMLFWKNRLNEVLSELIKWNLMKCKVQLI